MIKAIFRNGRIEPSEPIDLPEGTELYVEYVPVSEKIGLDESSWRDDEEARADWSAWLKTIDPVEFTERGKFEESFERFNKQVVRERMLDEEQ